MSGQSRAYTCHECREVIEGRQRWQQHGTKTAHQIRAPNTDTSVTPAQEPEKDAEAGNAEESSSGGSSETNGSPTCSVCHTVFLSENSLRQHLLSFTTCNVCNVHLPPDWVLEAHYATTDLHPKCDRCGLGFRDDEEFGWHIFECWADLESEAESSTHAGAAVGSSAPPEHTTRASNTAGKGKAPDRGSPPHPSSPAGGFVSITTPFPANQHARSSSAAAETQGQAISPRGESDDLRPSSSLGGSVCPPYSSATRYKDGDEGAQDRQSLTSSMPGIVNGRSVTYGSTDEDARSIASADSSSRTTAPRYTLSPRTEPPAYGLPLDTGAPRHSASSSTYDQSKELPSGSLSHRTSHNSAIANPGASSIQAANSGSASISWHCRLCSRSPCEQPVATMCGHVFCKSCILKEMEASPSSCCPVCQRMFLLGLKVSGT